MELALKILQDKISSKIAYINDQAPRKFDAKVDIVRFTLTPKQFYIIKKHFKLKETCVLCKGVDISDFVYEAYTIKSLYNDRMGCYELRAKHKEYIDDLDEQMDYFDQLYGTKE